MVKGLFLILLQSFSIALCSAQIRPKTSDYLHFFDQNECCKDLKQYDRILIIHFDFCHPDSYCGDTAKIKSLVSNSDFLLIDTLYNSFIPDYITGKKYAFVSREQLQRKGLYYIKPVLIRTNRKKIKFL